MVDFLADHPIEEIIKEKDILICGVDVQPWVLKFYRSSISKSAGAGVVITSPSGTKIALNFTLDFEYTNNQATYKALIIYLEILQDLRAKEVIIIGDS